VRVHELKHTFGHRLRAAGASFEDRQDLLGHKNRRTTTHYSHAELGAHCGGKEAVRLKITQESRNLLGIFKKPAGVSALLESRSTPTY
jgi:hypothetical protein